MFSFDRGCRPTMKHTPPFVDETIRQIVADGVTRLYSLPMSPLYSRSGTAAYHLRVRKALAAIGANIPVIEINDWHLFPSLVEAISLHLRTAPSMAIIDEPFKGNRFVYCAQSAWFTASKYRIYSSIL